MSGVVTTPLFYILPTFGAKIIDRMNKNHRNK